MNVVKHTILTKFRNSNSIIIPFAKIATINNPYKVDDKKTFYATTPIYYVNADPHIGHLYSSLLADTACRCHNLFNKNAKFKFSTGTDEHGTKIQEASSNNNMTPIDYCNKISKSYKFLAEDFEINYTDFIRTSDKNHLQTVQKFWNILHENNHIYSSNYEGWYCVPDETFLSKSQLKEVVSSDGKKQLVSIESEHPVEWTKEKNYLFRLSNFQNDLIHWLKSLENTVQPKKFHKILMDMISREPLTDISISRPSSRVSWGIPVPNDPTQTIYVWLDALVNYLTASGFGNDVENFNNVWPPNVQVIGKDILKFHGIYWPAFLMAANLDPPKYLLCHSHWTVAQEKMSKSKRNVVDPFERGNIYSTDGLRYFLLRVGVAHSDGNYNDNKVVRVLNSELADTLGNLLNRCSSVALNPKQEFPKMDRFAFEYIMNYEESKNLVTNVTNLPKICKTHFNDFNFYKAVDAIIATLHSANLFFESMKPWDLKKRQEYEKLDVVLHITIETLRVTGILLQPIIPTLTTSLLDKLNIDEDKRYFENLSEHSWSNFKFRSKSLSCEKIVLFRRLLLEEKAKMEVK